MNTILKYLVDNPGERMDTEIAKATGIALDKVRLKVSELSRTGELITCSYVRFVDGRRTEGWLCRSPGYVPPKAPGRKPAHKS